MDSATTGRESPIQLKQQQQLVPTGDWNQLLQSIAETKAQTESTWLVYGMAIGISITLVLLAALFFKPTQKLTLTEEQLQTIATSVANQIPRVELAAIKQVVVEVVNERVPQLVQPIVTSAANEIKYHVNAVQQDIKGAIDADNTVVLEIKDKVEYISKTMVTKIEFTERVNTLESTMKDKLSTLATETSIEVLKHEVSKVDSKVGERILGLKPELTAAIQPAVTNGLGTVNKAICEVHRQVIIESINRGEQDKKQVDNTDEEMSEKTKKKQAIESKHNQLRQIRDSMQCK